MVELPIHPGIGPLMIGFEFPMLDQRALPCPPQPLPMAPIIVAFVRYQGVEPFKVPPDDDGPDLGVVPAGGGW